MSNSINVPTAAPFYGRNIEDIFDWMNMIIYGDYGVGKTYLVVRCF